MSTPCKGGPDLSLDPANPPKYCPQCAWGGVKSKVKKLKVDPDSQKLVIMCKNEKCPWPFSVKSPDEVTVTDVSRSRADVVENPSMGESDQDTVSLECLNRAGDINDQLADIGSYSPVVSMLNKHEEDQVLMLDKIQEPQYDLDLFDLEPKDMVQDNFLKEENVNCVKINEDLNCAKEVSLSENAGVSTEEVVIDEVEHEKENEEIEEVYIDEEKFPSLFCLPDVLTPLPLTPDISVPLFSEFVLGQDGVSHQLGDKCDEDLPLGLENDGDEVQEDLIREGNVSPKKIGRYEGNGNKWFNSIFSPSMPNNELSKPPSSPTRQISLVQHSTPGQVELAELSPCIPTAGQQISSGMSRADESEHNSSDDHSKDSDSLKSIFDVANSEVKQARLNIREFQTISEVNTSEVEFEYIGSTETGDMFMEDVANLVAVIKPGRTFTRTPVKPVVPSKTHLSSLSNRLYLHTGLGIEAEVLPEEDLSLPTLALAGWQEDDPEFALVRKVGTGVTLDRELGQMKYDEGSSDISHPTTQEDQGNSVVFHVANQVMTTQPSLIDKMEVEGQNKTRVLVTTGSDQLELVDYEMECDQFNLPSERERGRTHHKIKERRDSGRGRGQKKCDKIKPSQQESGKGWFLWRDWRVDGRFIQGFSDYMKKIVIKWNLPRNSKIDSRVQALLKEKEKETENKVTVQKVISFFAEVFVKYLYIQTNFPNLIMDKLVDILQQHYTLENQQFAVQIRCIMLQEQPAGTTEMITRGTQTEDQNREGGHQSAYTELITQHTDSYPLPANSSSTPPSPVPAQPPSPSLSSLNTSHQSDPDPVDLSTTSPVYSDSCCSVEVATASTSSLDAVGQGAKLVQFFYTHPVDGSSQTFPPVRVNTEQEVSFVVALVTEKAEEYNRRNNIVVGSKQPIQYSTEAAMARSILDGQVVAHIKRCFTKKGMSQMKIGRKQAIRTGKRKSSGVTPSDNPALDSDVDSLHEEIEENVVDMTCQEDSKEVLDDVTIKEHVPTDEEIKESLEGQLFGGYLPKAVLRQKPQRTGASDRKGRGGRNETSKRNIPEQMVLGAVDYMLHSKKNRDEKIPEQYQPPLISMSSLLRKRKGRKKTNINFDDLTDDEDDDFKGANVKKADLPDEQNKRKSSRLVEKQKRVESGEYFDADNHEFKENQNTSKMMPIPHLNETSSSSKFKNYPELSLNSTTSTKTRYQMPSKVSSSSSPSNRTVGQTNDDENAAIKNINSVNENYLKSSKTCLKPELFKQVYTRKKHFEKVLKVVKYQKKKAERHLGRKYIGFGDQDDLKVQTVRKKIKLEKDLLRNVKKAQVSKEESDLIKELLEFAESEVNSKVESKASVEKEWNKTPLYNEAIQEFDEFHTLTV